MDKIESVCAGIVLFNPDPERLNDNIVSALKQVNKIVLIDNGSDNIEYVSDRYKQNEDIEIIKNGANKGIAFALNQIVEWGGREHFEWCVTLDQDSCMSDGMVEALMRYSDDPELALICPEVYDINMPEFFLSKGSEETALITKSTDVITSGSCVRISASNAIGGFNNEMFIDCVDFDFNERLIRKGYKILRVHSAKLIHELGHMEKRKFFFRTVKISNHSAFRRYYMTRNRLYFKRKYFGYFAYLKDKCRCLLVMIKCVLYEQDSINKIKAILKGMRDFKDFWKNNK